MKTADPAGDCAVADLALQGKHTRRHAAHLRHRQTTHSLDESVVSAFLAAVHTGAILKTAHALRQPATRRIRVGPRPHLTDNPIEIGNGRCDTTASQASPTVGRSRTCCPLISYVPRQGSGRTSASRPRRRDKAPERSERGHSAREPRTRQRSKAVATVRRSGCRLNESCDRGRRQLQLRRPPAYDEVGGASRARRPYGMARTPTSREPQLRPSGG